MKYIFSETQTASFYGLEFYSIKNELGELCAYSQRIFEIPSEVILHKGNTLIFEKAVLIKGEIRGGEIWGGVIRGGEIRGGVIEVSMLQIQGTRHFCYAAPTEDGDIILGIGCQEHKIDWWVDHYNEIGDEYNYTPGQVDEYWAYIQLFAKRYKPELLLP